MKEDLSELLDLVEMEDFLAYEGVDYKVTRGRSGVQLNLKECPRCGGSDWKVYLNADTGLGNCFHGSCAGEPGFNKLTFIKHLAGGGFKDALTIIKRYASATGWRPKTRTAPVKEAPPTLALPDSFPLPIKGKMLRYLADRGFTAATAEYFGWRFCKEGHFTYELNGEAKRQDYSNRVIIPVMDVDGKLVTFQGRSIEADPFRKYIFPPGLPGAGRYIYNAHNAKGKSVAIMGEGAFDVSAIKQAIDGHPTLSKYAVIGSFGKSLSMAASGGESDQLSDLKRLKEAGLREVIFMWDGEPSAIVDAINTALSLIKYGFKTKVAILPDGKDPNEVPAEVVREAISSAVQVNKLSAAALVTKYAKQNH